jgi:esterase/lipase
MEKWEDEIDIGGLMLKIIAGVVSLGTILVLGAYGYTWSEMKGEQDEKRQWRTEHQRVLDKRFDELKQGQEKINDTVNRNTDDTKMMLQQILDEQKRVDSNMRRSNNGSSNGNGNGNGNK